MRCATWNVNSLTVRLEHVLTWLKQADVDVLLLQETKVTDDKFPVLAIEAAGYHVVYSGQKTYNGVAVIARQPITLVSNAIADFEDEQRRFLVVDVAGVRCVCVYVPNGSTLDSPKFAYKLSWLSALKAYLPSLMEPGLPFLMAGDFNIAPADLDVYDAAVWSDCVLVSAKERQLFADFLAMGLVDSFRHFSQDPGFSWWDYRQGAFRRNHGLRIDHVLVNQDLLDRLSDCWVDRDPRSWERPSDHTPVVVEYSS